MKNKILITLLVILTSIGAYGHIVELGCISNLDGYIGDPVIISQNIRIRLDNNVLQVLSYRDGGHPSEWMWRVTINDYTIPSQKERNAYEKDDKVWFFKGTFEYYISDEFPDLKTQLLKYSYPTVAPWNHDTTQGQTPCVKRTMPAIIAIVKYQNIYPIVFHVYMPLSGPIKSESDLDAFTFMLMAPLENDPNFIFSRVYDDFK